MAFVLPVSIAASQFAAGLVILLGIWLFVSRADAGGINRIAGFAIAAYLATLVISSLLSPDLIAAWRQLGKSWVLLCILPLSVFAAAYDSKRIFQLLVFGTSLASLIGIYRCLIEGAARAAPYSGGFTTLALFEAAALPFAVVYISREKGALRIWNLVCLIVITVGLIMSQTRAGWVGALIATMVIGVTMNWKVTVVCIASFLLLVLAIPQSRNLVMNRFVAGDAGAFTSGRNLLWRDALSRIPELPLFGHGPGSFKRVVKTEILDQIGDKGVASWHSSIFDPLIESGPMALLSLLIIMIISLYNSWIRYYRSGRRLEYLAILSSLLALYLAGLSTNLFRDFMIMGLLAILWASVFDLQEKHSNLKYN